MNRRTLLMTGGALAASGGLILPGCSPAPTQPKTPTGPDPLRGEALMQDVSTYLAFGIHRSGSSGDKATSNWFADRFAALGYEIEQPEFEIPNADTFRASITLGNREIGGFCQPPYVRTPEGGLRAPLAVWNPAFPTDVAGRIAVVHVPREPGALSPSAAYRKAFEEAHAAGALGIIAPISSPSGEICAINVPADIAPVGPVLMVGEAMKAILDVAINSDTQAVLRVEGEGGMRPARNTIARRGKKGPWLIVSTPQSGWFTCGGERGPGVAMSLALADWAARQDFDNRLLFVTTSGHEWTDHGAHLFHENQAPDPAETALWLHLGASFAARGYEETLDGLKPLDTPNPTRTFMVSADLMPTARTAFAQAPGLEQPSPSSLEESRGELTLVIKEGYATHAGFFGAHGLFHTPFDDETATTPEIMEPIARACAALIEARLRGA